MLTLLIKKTPKKSLKTAFKLAKKYCNDSLGRNIKFKEKDFDKKDADLAESLQFNLDNGAHKYCFLTAAYYNMSDLQLAAECNYKIFRLNELKNNKTYNYMMYVHDDSFFNDCFCISFYFKLREKEEGNENRYNKSELHAGTSNAIEAMCWHTN